MTERRCGSCRCVRIMFGYAKCPWIYADNNHVTPGTKCKIPDSRFKRFKDTPEKFKEYIDRFAPIDEMLRDNQNCIHEDNSRPINCNLTGKKCTPHVPDPDKKLVLCMFTIRCPQFKGVLYEVKKGKFVPVMERDAP